MAADATAVPVETFRVTTADGEGLTLCTCWRRRREERGSVVAQSIALIRHIEVGKCLAALCEELQQRRLPPRRLSGGLLHGRQG